MLGEMVAVSKSPSSELLCDTSSNFNTLFGKPPGTNQQEKRQCTSSRRSRQSGNSTHEAPILCCKSLEQSQVKRQHPSRAARQMEMILGVSRGERR